MQTNRQIFHAAICLERLSPGTKGSGRKPLVTGKEFTEGSQICEMQAVGYLRYAELGGAQQESGLHEQVLVDIVDDRTPRNLTDHAREIDGRDV